MSVALLPHVNVEGVICLAIGVNVLASFFFSRHAGKELTISGVPGLVDRMGAFAASE
jgi:hypothetical protein